MASERRAAPGWSWPGQARARLTREAAALMAGAAFVAGNAPLVPALAQARMALRRACQLGQSDGAARAAALATLARAADETCGMPPSPAQLAAALGLGQGYALELDAAGGAPLAVALAAILAVWSGRSCHVVSASAYLAARDAAVFGPLYELCGCSVALLAADMAEADLAQCYARDIVYAPARQLLSDFLRDQLLLGGAVSPMRRAVRAIGGAQKPVTRGTDVAIIDDIEAVLVDDAVNPVVISAAGNLPVLNEATEAARFLIEGLQDGVHYTIAREPLWLVELSTEGEQQLDVLSTRLPVYWRHPQRRRDLVSSALLARDVLERDRHYVLDKGRVTICDESVFRLLAGRVWHFGMLQALEAREGLALTTPPRTVGRTAVQTFFPRYAQLSGIGACLDGCGPELGDPYGLPLVSLLAPGARTVPERHYGYRDREAKLAGFLALAAHLHARGTPVLVAAPRPEDMLGIGRGLAERGLRFEVADCRDPAADALVLAGAGREAQITLMICGAGRGSSVPGKQVHGLLFEHGEVRRADQAFFAMVGQAAVFASLEEARARVLPLWAIPLRAVGRWEAFGVWPVRAMIALAQWHSARHGARYRKAMGAREAQLDEQLAFSGQR
jgi:preprotein translocase subunit SecA